MEGVGTAESPVILVGAGAERGLEPLVLERDRRAGAAVAEWNHVRLCSSWPELVAPAAERLLTRMGWQRPEPGTYPTGQEWVARYLEPLAAALGERVRFDTEVVGVARRGRDRVVDPGHRACDGERAPRGWV
jgi:hypothetical protein